MAEVTHLLMAIERGEAQAAEALLPVVYEELRRLAAMKLAREKPGQTLQATALVHEAWLRLVGHEPEAAQPRWEGRRHFFGAAAEAMRRILIENARRKASGRHGGGLQRVELEQVEPAAAMPPDDLLALDEALQELAAVDPKTVELIRLRFYAGLTAEQAAEVLGISRRTADRMWSFGRAWLYRAMRGGRPGPG
ncbi:MAG TPA: ECF-type sigma factor [Verrucomicrobiota bacterium]|nr:ECF-type sigma factor [Verrucomicrobiota bacterium]HNU50505.1 ECF-type sigma factor [Verrucomicrobiota bacterium]